MEYAAVFAIQNINNGEPVFVVDSHTLDAGVKDAILPRFNSLPVVTNAGTEENASLFGIATTHIKQYDMGSVAVSGIVPIKVLKVDPLYSVNASQKWLLAKAARTSIVGTILKSSQAFCGDGECTEHLVQLMPWISELQVNSTDDTTEQFKKNLRLKIQQSLSQMQASANTPITADTLASALFENVHAVVNDEIFTRIENSLLGN